MAHTSSGYFNLTDRSIYTRDCKKKAGKSEKTKDYNVRGDNGHFLAPLNDAASLVVPTVTIYEVFKVVLRESSENNALQAVIAMQKGTVVDLTITLAIAASKLSLEHNLPMADSIILATARAYNATLWTQDSDFKDISDVKYFPKK